MPATASPPLSIQHLRLQAAQGGGLRRATVTHLRQQLDQAHWPDSGESWVFIRSLQLRGSSQQISPQLASAIHQHLHSSGQNIMRFANTQALLAAQLTDLLNGHFGQRWYWQAWQSLASLPLPQAIHQLLTDQAQYLPALLAHLEQAQLLPDFIKAIDEATAYQLAQEIAIRQGISLPGASALRQAQQQIALQQSTQGPPPAPLPGSPHQQRFLQQFLRQRWQPALALVPTDSARQRLILLLIAQQQAPLLLQQNPLHLLAQLAQALAPVRPDFHKSASAKTFDQNGALEPSNTDHAKAPPHPASQRRPTSPPQESPITEIHPATPDLYPQDDPEISTQQGGLLYLLNFLNRPQAQALMLAHSHLLPHGWAWLYRLGQELALDEQDPLAHLIAQQLGFAHPQELAELPPLPARNELQALAQQWYGRQALWQPALLQRRASIRYSPTHIDLYASLNSVQLPVRLAGLDINPGWLPWLGKVVTFHYD